jgi:hypothetical protein
MEACEGHMLQKWRWEVLVNRTNPTTYARTHTNTYQDIK